MDHRAEYPVQDASPSFSKVVENFSGPDYGKWGVVVASGLALGYYKAGKSRAATMGMAGTLGVVGGFLLAYELSMARLMGMSPPQKK